MQVECCGHDPLTRHSSTSVVQEVGGNCQYKAESMSSAWMSLTNASASILYKAIIAGTQIGTKGVRAGGVLWTRSIDSTFIHICSARGWRKLSVQGRKYVKCVNELHQCKCFHSSQSHHCMYTDRSQRCSCRWSVVDTIHWLDIHPHL